MPQLLELYFDKVISIILQARQLKTTCAMRAYPTGRVDFGQVTK